MIAPEVFPQMPGPRKDAGFPPGRRPFHLEGRLTHNRCNSPCNYSEVGPFDEQHET